MGAKGQGGRDRFDIRRITKSGLEQVDRKLVQIEEPIARHKLPVEVPRNVMVVGHAVIRTVRVVRELKILRGRQTGLKKREVAGIVTQKAEA
jgi:hypothetical protein